VATGGSSKASENGKANEWAVAAVLADATNCSVELDSTALLARKCFEELGADQREHMLRAASAAIDHILKLEETTLAAFQPIKVWMPPDSHGQKGDVRDVILICDGFAFGISCKNNHEAYKHSRLSGNLDWVRKWGLSVNGCSTKYWEGVRPVFELLNRLKHESNGEALFKSIDNMHVEIYTPVLKAFEEELLAVFASGNQDETSTGNLVRYIVGRQDFYKVITKPKSVVIHRFNFNKSLSGPKSQVPTKVVGVDRLEGSSNSINVRFDRGWVFNFRIHNASSRVEPSLKFDIQAIGLPSSEIYRHEIFV
jgi:hypothetical protein